MPILLFLSCAGRQTFEHRVYDALTISQVTYKRTLVAAAEANHNGKISNDDLDKILEVAKKWQHTHNLALTLTQEYVSLKRVDPEKAAGMEHRIVELNQSLDRILLEFLSLLRRMGVKT